jgi:predicted GTPase
VVILGAAGRDFHDFNVVFRDDPEVRVVAFTAAQIPDIAGRTYPAELAGVRYPMGIPIRGEAELEEIVRAERVDEVVFSYSDVSHEEVMHRASRVLAAGASFRLLGPRETMLTSTKPVVSVCAVRTGSGKSPVARRVAAFLRTRSRVPVVVRHPMPYGNLSRQAVQRFGSLEDLDRERCTVEEREEYEPHIAAGNVVFAGVDYARVLELAEREADVIVWDGGNNDYSFFRPDLEIVLLDPHRAGDELRYHPGETNLRRADIVLVTKVETATPAGVDRVRENVQRINSSATLVECDLAIRVDRPELLAGARTLVIEDGPTTTHGGMGYGAGLVAAQRHGAREIVDPRPFARGSLRETFEQHPHVTRVLPAMGYSEGQLGELAATIARADCDVVVLATPSRIERLIELDKPCVRVTYELADRGEPTLDAALEAHITRLRGG